MEEKKQTRSLAELQFRARLARTFENICRNMDDPRAADAAAEYHRQAENLDKQIAELNPPPVVVHVKPAVLSLTSKGD